ncbi:CHAT domain-containing protein [Streptomyces sp. NBC_00091]|uniref:CHAT domain-containing protein n=1 Tax=Streptomyces sp. NBC_00091 TaxID=2975648 RepID=UPI002250F584|nr:CHAT domain-containing protein [Streptomyces sp. NBC_00091]MCX5380692.1 CHAT domain-containing protein [Streptomyces sp. NBC_00091]
MPADAHPLRAALDEVMAALAALPAGDPGAPELCGRAGELSYRLYEELAGPEDLDLAAEAFAHAFRRPAEGPSWPLRRIMYGHLLALQHDERPDLELAGRIHALLAAGLAELPDEPELLQPAVLARWLLAYITKRRVMDGADDPALLDEALERGRAALDDTDGQDADLQEALGFLWQRHGIRTDDTASYARSARYYADVLAGGDPDRDLPLVRQSRGMSLILQGYHAADRAALEEGRDETLRALADAGQRPEWERDARLRVAFARAMIAGSWSEEEEGDRAEAELAGLLTTGAEMDALPWFYLDVFGRYLSVRAQTRLDVAAMDRAIALLTRAVDRWEPAQGEVTLAALALAYAQQQRYETDQDPQRPGAIERAALLALEGDGLPAETRDMLLMLVSEAQHRQGPAHPQTVSFEEVMRVYEDFRDRLRDGASPDLSFDTVVNAQDSPARGMWERRFSELFESWRTVGHGLERAERAAHFLTNLQILDPDGERLGPQRETELTRTVLAYADEDPEWRGHGLAVLGNFRLAQGMAGLDADRLTQAVEHFEAAVRAGNDSPWLTYGATLASGMLAQLRGITSGSGVEEADWERMRTAMGGSPKVDRLLRVQQAAPRAMLAARRGDLAEADRQVAEAARAVAEWDPEDPSLIEAVTLLESARMAREDLARRLGAAPTPPPAARPTARELRRQAARLPRLHRANVIGNTALAWRRDALLTGDLPRIRETLALTEEAISLAEPGGETWIRLSSDAGSTYGALVTANEEPRSPQRARDLERAITLLEGATGAMGGPEHRLWALSVNPLGRAYRVRGSIARRDRERGRRLGLEAMRGFVWSALLQSGTQDAAEAARMATGLSEEVLGWCVADRAPQDALQALDACRGLVLHAATTSRSVPELLTAAGRDALAAEWRTAGAETDPDSVPSALRRRVVLALAEAGTRLLDPPSPQEIGAALSAQGKDALVYLVAATAECPGTALVVTSGGDVHEVPLPGLRADAAPLRAYRPGEGTAPRDIEPVPGYGPARPEPAPPLRDRLDRLCSWAWRAALRPLLGLFQVPDRPGRVPRLVLVPMGPLGLVPWHAAFADGGTGRRYALQDAEISYAASARLLCEVAARPAAAHTGAALIVGNPTGDLPYAGEEADAVHRVFYPDGDHLGLRTGDGTPAEVARWLRERADGGAVLHLACHGTVEENRPRSSYLALKGGALTAEELAGAVRGPLGLVVLAACRSQVSGRGHNEAYSLSSAFLAAGSRSVIGSLWPVPDEATSVLMFLTHHYLRREQEPPARALRRAQLWMLDPHRTVPDGLPPALAARLAHLDPHDLSAWAGFTHLGQ